MFTCRFISGAERGYDLVETQSDQRKAFERAVREHDIDSVEACLRDGFDPQTYPASLNGKALSWLSYAQNKNDYKLQLCLLSHPPYSDPSHAERIGLLHDLVTQKSHIGDPNLSAVLIKLIQEYPSVSVKDGYFRLSESDFPLYALFEKEWDGEVEVRDTLFHWLMPMVRLNDRELEQKYEVRLNSFPVLKFFTLSFEKYSLDIFERLIGGGVSVDERDSTGYSALNSLARASSERALTVPQRKDLAKLMMLLLDNQCNPFSVANDKCCTMGWLMKSKESEYQEVKDKAFTVLAKLGIDVGSLVFNGSPLIVEMAKLKSQFSASAIKEVIEHIGSGVNVTDERGNTALLFLSKHACQEDHVSEEDIQNIKALLSLEADTLKSNQAGNCALGYLLAIKSPAHGRREFIQLACRNIAHNNQTLDNRTHDGKKLAEHPELVKNILREKVAKT